MPPSKQKTRTSKKTKTSRKSSPSKIKKGKKTTSRKKPTRVLIAHDNKTPGHTTKAHKLAERLAKDPNYEVIRI